MSHSFNSVFSLPTSCVQALHEDPRMLLGLMDYAPPGAFTRLAAADGTTPFHLAFQVSACTVPSRLIPSTFLKSKN